MKKILIISFSDLSKDPRVRRHIFSLKENFQITAIGYENCNIENVNFIKVNKPKWNIYNKLYQRVLLLLKMYEKVYNELPYIKEISKDMLYDKYDLIFANDIEALPLALRIKGKAKVLYDAHEYAPRQFEDNFWWNFYFLPFKDYLCSKYLAKSDYIFTVSKGLLKEYQSIYNVKCNLLTNAAPFHSLSPSILESNIKIIYHGYANKSRSIHLMIEMMDYIDDKFTLDLMIIPSYDEYFQRLKKMAEQRSNVNIIAPVKFDKIIPFTNNYDIGIFLVPPTTFNLEYCLPNKFFEFIQARLMVAIGPSVEMANLVNKYKLGIVTKDFNPKNMAIELNKLTREEIIQYKDNANYAASILSSEQNDNKLITAIDVIINSFDNSRDDVL